MKLSKANSKEERNQMYLDYIEAKTPKGSWAKSLFHAFLVGGGICVFGQVLADVIKSIFPLMDINTVLSWVNVIIITITIILTGIGVFDRIGRYAGAGTVIPITGFANAIGSSALEFKKEGLVFGLGSKMFAVAGPVIVNGVTFSIIVGIIYFIVGLF